MELDFIKTKNLADALEIISALREQAVVTAGATEVMIDLRAGKLNSEVTTLVDISSLSELDFISEEGNWVRIGSGSTHAAVSESSVIKKYTPFLSKAAESVGSPQTRNRGTIGGNIITAAQCADTIPPLLVLDAVLVLESSKGSREISLEDFLAAGKSGSPMNADELLREIRFEKPDSRARCVFDKLIRRKSVAKARINFCAMAVQDNERRVVDIRIAPGSVTPVNMRFKDAESLFMQKIPERSLIKEAAEKISALMVEVTGERWSTPFKRPVLKIMAERGLLLILEVTDE